MNWKKLAKPWKEDAKEKSKKEKKQFKKFFLLQWNDSISPAHFAKASARRWNANGTQLGEEEKINKFEKFHRLPLRSQNKYGIY